VQACKIKKNNICVFNFLTALIIGFHWVFLLVNIDVF
jgi:hypothetical protein